MWCIYKSTLYWCIGSVCVLSYLADTFYLLISGEPAVCEGFRECSSALAVPSFCTHFLLTCTPTQTTRARAASARMSKVCVCSRFRCCVCMCVTLLYSLCVVCLSVSLCVCHVLLHACTLCAPLLVCCCRGACWGVAIVTPSPCRRSSQHTC